VKIDFESNSQTAPYWVFPSVFRYAVIHELLAKGTRVYSSEAAASCDRVEMHAKVVKLYGARHTPYYAGEYATLAQGVVVVRNVARAASTAIVAPAVLGAEIAYWLSPSYLTRHPMAEVAINVSRVSGEHEYISEYTNVYYVDARDVDAYAEKTSSRGYAAPAHPVEVTLPILIGPKPAEAKATFAGTKAFRAAGSSEAFLVGAAADGSRVVGNIRFGDRRWHVATMGPTGSVVDLGTLGGFQACATGISADGNVIVGRVQVDGSLAVGSCDIESGTWTAFKAQLSKDGASAPPQLLLTGSYLHPNVLAVLVSADGSAVIATVSADAADQQRKSHAVGWHNGVSAKDSLAGPLKDRENQPCYAEGISADGTSVAVGCIETSSNSGRTQKHHYVVSGLGNQGTVESNERDEFAPLNTVLGMSNDLSTAVGFNRDRDGNSKYVVKSLLSRPGGVSADVPPGFVPTGMTSDGGIVVGSSPTEASSKAAAVWSVSNGATGWPALVFDPGSASESRTGTAKIDCAFVAGDYLNGSLLLVNGVVKGDRCSAGHGAAAWVIAP